MEEQKKKQNTLLLEKTPRLLGETTIQSHVGFLFFFFFSCPLSSPLSLQLNELQHQYNKLLVRDKMPSDHWRPMLRQRFVNK